MLILSLSLSLSEKHRIWTSAYRTSVEESKNGGEQLQEAVRQQGWYTKEALTKLSQKTKGMPNLYTLPVHVMNAHTITSA